MNKNIVTNRSNDSQKQWLNSAIKPLNKKNKCYNDITNHTYY